jgi:hypothetical protein
MDDRGQQVVKSLKEIGFEQYYQAEQTGWVLYLEGSTDLAILRAFAEVTEHSAKAALERPFVRYVENQPSRARDHFRGLREAKPDLIGFLLCDRVDVPLRPTPELDECMWQRREIENYLCQPETLLAYAAAQERDAFGPLFAGPEAQRRRQAMEESITDHVIPAALKNRGDPWWDNVKASDEFLDRVFEAYLKRLELPRGLIKKSDYHVLARFVPRSAITPEVVTVLDRIDRASRLAQPRK